MNEQKKVLYAKFHQAFPWLQKIFSPENTALLSFTDSAQRAIFDELAANWMDGEVIAILNDLQRRYGAKVAEVIELAISTILRRDWAEVGRQQPSQTLNDFIHILWDSLPAIGFEFTSTKTANGVQMHCTHCPLVALGEALDAKTWLYHLICGGDPHMAAGFNPRIGFHRTKTLMQGDAYCDHTYFMQEA